MTQIIKGTNLRFIARNAEVAVAHLMNEGTRDMPKEFVDFHATNLAKGIWYECNPVTYNEGMIALANVIAKISQWAIDLEDDYRERHKS